MSASSLTVAGAPAETLKIRPLTLVGVRGLQVRCDDVVDVREVARLPAVVEDRHRLAGGDRRDEERHDSGVLRARVLSRPEHVEVAENDGLERGTRG